MAPTEGNRKTRTAAFWKIAGAGAAFQAGSSAVDSATIVASLAYHLTGNVYAVGAASAVLRLGWLLPQIVVGFLAQRARRRMPFYKVGAFGRAACLALIAVLLALSGDPPGTWTAVGFLLLWTVYAFISGIVAVPYNDIVGRSIPSEERSRMLALRFFGGGILALGVAAIVGELLATQPVYTAYGLTFAMASVLMLVSSVAFVSAGEPPGASAPGMEQAGFGAFLKEGLQVVGTDERFRLFLFSQWLGGATLMALPFYVVAATDLGLRAQDVAILLGAQTVGSLASNAAWGRIGDRLGKVRLLVVVGVFRIAVPFAALALLSTAGAGGGWMLAGFAVLFVAVGALVNGMTIGYLGYLMEISPDDRRPSYSAYFNALASPAALLPLAGAAIVDRVSLQGVFAVAMIAAAVQLVVIGKLARMEKDRCG
jgi:MFS family permease